MRMYIYADSKLNQGYTPDWLKVTTIDGTEIIFDIQGDIDYDITALSCRVKGDLIPWVTYDEEGNEINLYDNPELFDESTILEIFNNTTNFTIGLFPCGEDWDEDKVMDDVFENKKCVLLYKYKEIIFTFDVEINI